MQGTFDAQFLQFGLGSFGALCKISDSTIFETLLLQQLSSDFNQTSYCGVLWFPSLCCLRELWKRDEVTPPDPSLNGTQDPTYGRREPLVWGSAAQL